MRSGALKAMAVATPSKAMPNVPTVRSLGFPNLELQGWNGFLAPAQTPKAIVARLHGAIAKILSDPAVQDKLKVQGVEPLPLHGATTRQRFLDAAVNRRAERAHRLQHFLHVLCGRLMPE